MASPYNYTALKDGTNFVEWMFVINDWTGGLLVTGIVIMGFLVTFGIMRSAKVATANCLAAGGFIWLLITILLWAIQWQNYTLIPTVIPFIFGIVTGLGVMGLLLKGIWDG